MEKKPVTPLPAAEAPSTSPVRSRRKSGGLTLSDVARIADVAPITASRALKSPDLVSPAVLQRVRDAVEKTGYVPNLLAGGLASTKSKLVAAVVPTITGAVFLEMVQSLTASLAASGYQLMLGQSGYENSREDALLEAIIGRRPDGVVLTGIMRSALAKRRLQVSGIPVVETWDLTSTPVDMLVGFSHEKIGVAVAEFLHARGRRKVATISANDDRAVRRNKAFSDTALSLGMLDADSPEVPTCIVPAPTTLGSGRSGLRSLLLDHPNIDAIFCSSDMLALGVLTEAQAMGIAVPEKLAVIGLGDLSFSCDLNPALTTVRIDGSAIGAIAADFIIQRAEGKVISDPIRDIGFSIIERDST
ncbi:LacI family DNA-binding transcriptional regulator [Undibacterium sp. Di26W]|uniref:LacI family DNA-binding transcriptional regulator n=1 Tax=Undibacterium sp. Di26W TaxID=3413035 RepID=UPI003BF12298